MSSAPLLDNLTQKELKKWVRYDPRTGIFTRIKRSSNRALAGQVAGHKNDSGYLRFCIGSVRYYSHRLAWLYMTGHWPKEIDHKNCVKTDNRWKNLRDVSRSINKQNLRGPTRGSKTGRLGVYKDGNKFIAGIGIGNRRHKHLGRFDSLALAAKAYLAAKRILHTGNTL